MAIETETTWEDTGYDCDHCGGRIFRRTDRETGQPDRTCFQCEDCGCQWTLSHRPLRVGTKAACRPAQRLREDEAATPDPYMRWVLGVLLVIVILVLIRFGGAVVVRAALPAAIGLAALYLLARYGRHEGWW